MSDEYEDLKEQKNRIIEKDRSTLLRQYRERLDKRDTEITSLRTQLAKKEKEWVGIVTEEMNKNGKLRAELEEKEKEIKRLKRFIEKGCSDDSSQCCFLTELLYLRDFVDGLKDRAKKAEAELAKEKVRYILLEKKWMKENLELSQELAALREKYYELIMAVSCKCPNETRHETALRYILERENSGKNSSAKMEINNDIS